MGFSINQVTISRLWSMLAHTSGQLFNMAKLGQSLGVTAPTVKSYMEILEKTFMIRVVQPWHANVKKRLVKSPKVYLRDTGILHALLELASSYELLGHPIYGQSWESYALEQTLAALPRWSAWFYRSSDGSSEIDLILVKGDERIAIEFKASTAPQVGVGLFHALALLQMSRAYIVCPFNKSERYPYRQATVVSLDVLIDAVGGLG